MSCVRVYIPFFAHVLNLLIIFFIIYFCLIKFGQYNFERGSEFFVGTYFYETETGGRWFISVYRWGMCRGKKKMSTFLYVLVLQISCLYLRT